MKSMKRNWITLFAVALAAACVMPAAAFAAGEPILGEPVAADAATEVVAETGANEDAFTTAATYASPSVAYHSADDIRNYIFDNPVYVYSPATWKTQPKLTAPYAAGALSDQTLTDALWLLKCYRYVAGLSDAVTLDASYSQMCQAGSLLNAVNDELSHYPVQPAGMDNGLYDLGYAGCSSSNLAAGYADLQLAIMGWMDDSDSYNVDRLGHRRWVLNPTMGKTGFGEVYNPSSPYRYWTSMYSFDMSNTSATQKNVAWPAQNTPVHLFYSSHAWSLSTGDYLDASTVVVTVKRASDGKTWRLSQASSDGYFNVNNDSYGQRGCVIFLPNGITANEGDSYTVTVDGVPNPVSYKVNFFSLYQKTTSATLSQTSFTYNGSAQKPTAKVYAGTKLLTSGKDYVVNYSNNKNAGTATATIEGIGRYSGALTKTFKINPKKASVSFAVKSSSVALTGSAAKCGVKSVKRGSTSISSSQYTVTYANNKAVGKATVTVALKGNYTGSKKLTFKVIPKATAGVKLTALSKGIKVKWTKGASAQATGYQLRFATTKAAVAKAKVKATVTKRATVTKTFKNLKAKKKYYVQVRTYKTVKGTKYFSAWTTAKAVTTKK